MSLINVIPKIPGFINTVVKVTEKLYKSHPWRFRKPTKKQVKLIKEGKLKPETFTLKRLQMETEKAFKDGGPQTKNVRLPTTTRAEKLEKMIERSHPLASKKGKARGGPVGYTERWKKSGK